MNQFNQWYSSQLREAQHMVAELDEYHKRKPHCHKGCDDCCHQFIQIYPYEAYNILYYLSSTGQLETTLQKLQQISISIPDDHFEYYLEQIPCIFLKNKQCQIHPVRPISCLNYYSTQSCSPLNKIFIPDHNYRYEIIEAYITEQVADYMKGTPERYPAFFYVSQPTSLTEGLTKALLSLL